jgi:GH35 family endo-1,4-beta-xylanase
LNVESIGRAWPALGLLAALAPAIAALGAAEGPSLRERQDAAIRRHRMGTIVVRAEPGAPVQVIQQSHEFWFGTAVAAWVFRERFPEAAREEYLRILRENFNSAVFENALKWPQMERRQGETRYADVDRALAWCQENGMPVRGHCIFWALEKYVPRWLRDLPEGELRGAVERRARDVASRYRGRIPEYDVNNEMLHGDFFARRLGPPVRADMFRWAHEEDPSAVLYVNDYELLSGRLVDEYEAQIQGLIDAGAPVGGIGCQGHAHGPIDPERIARSLDRLARFGLPVRITEFDVEGPTDEEHARRVEAFYRACFAHPAVTGVLMWGFWEGAHWRPKAALWRKDFSPRPAAEAYRRLVFEEWWTRWEGFADGEGRCEVPAFYGTHLIRAGERTAELTLRRAQGRAEANLR